MIIHDNRFPILTELERGLPLYVTSAGGWHNQETMQRERGFPDYQWIQCLSGKGRLELPDSGPLYIESGQGMLLFPNEAHSYQAVDEPWSVRWVSFNGADAHSILDRMGLTSSRVMTLSNFAIPLHNMQEAYSILSTNDPLRGYEGSAIVYRLLLDLVRYAAAPNELRSRQQRYDQLVPVLEYIEQNSTSQLTLPELASCIGVSSQYLCTLFQQAMNMRPFEYITKVRLRAAKELLLSAPDRPVQDIAEACGYDNPSYFIKLFRQHEGVTPAVFRRIRV